MRVAPGLGRLPKSGQTSWPTPLVFLGRNRQQAETTPRDITDLTGGDLVETWPRVLIFLAAYGNTLAIGGCFHGDRETIGLFQRVLLSKPFEVVVGKIEFER